MSKTKTAYVLRNRELAAIHIARQQLGMDDDTYRDMLFAVARVRSAADLDWAGRKKVLDHLTSRGAQVGAKSRLARNRQNEWSFISRAAPDCQPLLRKICAVCIDMRVGKDYAEGVAKRQHGVERHLEMMSHSELWKLAGALGRTRTFKAKDAPPPDGGISQGERPE